MAQLKLALPKGTRLIEPFCGSGAVMMNTAYSSYVLADINADVINTYDTIRNAAENVIAALTELYETCRTREHYDAIRKEFNARTADSVRMAAMFIYMNRHGYRGLCRYNKRKGEFNVPWGITANRTCLRKRSATWQTALCMRICCVQALKKR